MSFREPSSLRPSTITESPVSQPHSRWEIILTCLRSADGTPCYTAKKWDDGRCHIDAIIKLMEDEPPYDPRTQVNMEASKLYWGTIEQRREYNRKLRR